MWVSAMSGDALIAESRARRASSRDRPHDLAKPGIAGPYQATRPPGRATRHSRSISASAPAGSDTSRSRVLSSKSRWPSRTSPDATARSLGAVAAQRTGQAQPDQFRLHVDPHLEGYIGRPCRVGPAGLGPGGVYGDDVAVALGQRIDFDGPRHVLAGATKGALRRGGAHATPLQSRARRALKPRLSPTPRSWAPRRRGARADGPDSAGRSRS